MIGHILCALEDADADIHIWFIIDLYALRALHIQLILAGLDRFAILGFKDRHGSFQVSGDDDVFPFILIVFRDQIAVLNVHFARFAQCAAPADPIDLDRIALGKNDQLRHRHIKRKRAFLRVDAAERVAFKDLVGDGRQPIDDLRAAGSVFRKDAMFRIRIDTVSVLSDGQEHDLRAIFGVPPEGSVEICWLRAIFIKLSIRQHDQPFLISILPFQVIDSFGNRVVRRAQRLFRLHLMDPAHPLADRILAADRDDVWITSGTAVGAHRKDVERIFFLQQRRKHFHRIFGLTPRVYPGLAVDQHRSRIIIDHIQHP